MMKICRLSVSSNGWRASAGNPSTRPAYQLCFALPYQAYQLYHAKPHETYQLYRALQHQPYKKYLAQLYTMIP